MVTLQPKPSANSTPEPIVVKFDVTLTDDTEPATRSAIEDAFHFGGDVTIPGQLITEYSVNAPASLGLSGPWDVERVELKAAAETEGLPSQLLAVYAPGAALPLASLPFKSIRRTKGYSGTRITAVDVFDAIRMVTTLDTKESQFTLTLSTKESAGMMPSAVLPGLRLFQAFGPPNEFRLTLRLGDTHETHTQELTEAPGPLLPDGLMTFVEDLAVVQDRLNQPFPLPDVVMRSDRALVGTLRGLLDGAAVPWWQGPITAQMTSGAVDGLREARSSDGAFVLRVSYG